MYAMENALAWRRMLCNSKKYILKPHTLSDHTSCKAFPVAARLEQKYI